MGRMQGDLCSRTYQFALQILELCDQMPHIPKVWHMSKQIIRCGTSIGANLREVDHALTAREFAMKCSIARKEAAETHYWLELAQDSGILTTELSQPMIKEADELVRVIGAVVKNTQAGIERTG